VKQIGRQTILTCQYLSFVLLAVLVAGCVKQHANQPYSNEHPKTYIWLFPDSTITEGPSKQHIRWWGEDADGYIVGYLLAVAPGITVMPSLDTLTYVFVTISDTTIRFPLRQARQPFLVVVRAVDNSFKLLPEGASVRLTPQPYWDQNVNGVFDAGDVPIAALTGAMDPVAARLVFPTKNTPPSLSYLVDPVDPTRIIQPPESTFTVASFSWTATDPDGDETIIGYRFALNDSSSTAQWFDIAASVTMVTLMVPRARSDNNSTGFASADVFSGSYPNMHLLGIVNGLRLNAQNVFYVEAKDVANALSPAVRLPISGKKWYVKKPGSRLLAISDYQKSDLTTLRAFYRTAFGGAAGGVFANYDELDIRYGSVPPTPGVFVPPFSQLNPAFILTLKLFDCVFWYTDAFPSLSVAQIPLFYYTSIDFPTKVGKVIFTTEFQSSADPSGALRDFAPVDSVSSDDLSSSRTFPSSGDTRVPGGYVMQPDSEDMSDIFPVLSYVAAPPNCFIRPVYKRTDARYLYHLQPDQPRSRPDGSTGIRYYGSPNLVVMDNAKRFVFVGVPLNYLDGSANGGKGVSALLNRILVQEFGF